MDVVNIKIKIENTTLTREEQTDVIVNHLRSLGETIDGSGGHVQSLKGKDEDSSLEYVHLRGAKIV